MSERWRAVWWGAGLLVVAGVLGVACGESGGSGGGDPAAEEDPESEAVQLRLSVLSNLAQEVILGTYVSFEASVGELESACGAWAASGSAEDRVQAQEAWSAAMSTWQEAELYQVGPAGLSDAVAGGQELRDEIYSWPLTNACRVDQELVEQNYQDPEAFASEPINVRGLDAMEYLLFYEGTDNDCAPNSAINRDGQWATVGPEALPGRRAAYAHTLALDLKTRAAALRQAWAPEGDDFVSSLSRAGVGSPVYPSTQAALNAVLGALFYLETETKDMKLAVPAGLSDCSAEVCPEALESEYAQRSTDHVVANLRAFRRAFLGAEPGTDAPGFDDLLVAVGAGALSEQITQALEQALAAAEAVRPTMRQALSDDPDKVVAAYDAIKTLMDLIKTQFLGVLDLELPQRAEGDND